MTQQAGPPSHAVCTGISETFTLSSKRNHNEYLIQTFLPNPAAPLPGYPVLYCLDGSVTHGGACDLARIIAGTRKLHPDMLSVIIVSIGFQTDLMFNEVARARDFTNPPTEQQKAASRFDFGGDADFAAFIETELKPEIARRLPVNVEQQALFGHSLGGLFAMNTFFFRPSNFSKIIAASPSVWYNDFQLLQVQREWAARQPSSSPSPMLMVTFGTMERNGPSERPHEETEAFRREFVETFTNRNAVQPIWTFQHEGEHHITNLFASLPKAVLLASCQSTEACRALLDRR